MSRAVDYKRDDMMGDRLRQLAQAAGFASLADFARQAGVNVQAAQKQAARDAIPAGAAAKYIRAARGTGADIGWLLTGQGTAPVIRLQPKLVDRPQSESARSLRRGVEHTPIPVPSEWRNGDMMMPLRETVEVAGAGHFMLTQRVVDELPRPANVSPQTPIFAIYYQSDDMDPRYERGDRLLVNPALPLVAGKDYLLLTQPDPAGRQRGIVRRLLSFTDSHWRVRLYHPAAKDVSESRNEWPICQRIEATRHH